MAHKKKIPDECTSSICNPNNNDYCPKCSHAIYKGSCKVAGILFSWEYNPRLGPTFNIDMPTEFIGYDRFETWLEKYF